MTWSCDPGGKYCFEEAFYDLGCLGSYAGDDDQFRAAYARVLVKLPEDVRHYALDRCTVLSIGRAARGIVWPSRIVDRRRCKWLIVMDEECSLDLESAIAHELAHAWLQHDRLSPDVDPNCEAAADSLAVEWGFSRSYAEAATND